MKYMGRGQEIRVGDDVLVEDDAPGIVVCDFDRQEFLPGYESWGRQDDAVIEGIPATGVLIKMWGGARFDTWDNKREKTKIPKKTND